MNRPSCCISHCLSVSSLSLLYHALISLSGTNRFIGIPVANRGTSDLIEFDSRDYGFRAVFCCRTFNRLWTQAGQNVNKYKNYPRLIGECGGKNFHFVHPSADVETVVNGTILSSFEFCGQKCSACSRMYVPQSLWPQVISYHESRLCYKKRNFVKLLYDSRTVFFQIKEGLIATRDLLKVGDVQEFDSFMGAVIDDKAFKRITSYIELAKCSPELEIIAGGKYDDK